jgi:predicted dinucleotide-binding enzyme
MKIGIIGTGAVARALAAGYARHGHEVRLGTREPGRADLEGFAIGPVAEVAAAAELIVLAVPGAAAAEVASSIGSESAGKVLIDTTNWVERTDVGLRLGIGPEDSLGEQVQRAAPEARVVKAYNSVGNEHMVDPGFADGTPTMLIAGDDPAAKAEVTALLESTGWDVADFGGIEAGRLFDSMVLTWVGYAMATGSRTHAFRMLRA